MVRIVIPGRWTRISHVPLWKALAPVGWPLDAPLSGCIICSLYLPLRLWDWNRSPLSLNLTHILNSQQITQFKGVICSKQDPDKHHLNIIILKNKKAKPYISQFLYFLECKHELDATNQTQSPEICIWS